MALAALLGAGLAAGALAARPDQVELLVPAPLDEEPQVVVLEDGQQVTGVAIERLSEDWRVVLVFDQLLSSPLVVKTAALDLAALAPELVALGEVEIVLAGDEIALSLPPTRDVERLEEALSWISVREGGAAGQLEIRRRFLTSPVMADLAAEDFSPVSATAGRRIAELRDTAGRFVDEEIGRLERQRQGLLAWAAEAADERPRLLVFVSEGWDEDPFPFYRKVLRRVRVGEAVEGLASPGPTLALDTMGRAISALGWRVAAFTPSRLVEPQEETAAEGSGERVEGDDRVETVIQDGQEVERTLLKGVDPRQLWRRLSGGPLTAELLAAERPLEDLAAASGGSRVEDRRQLGRALAELRSMARVLYPTPPSAPLDAWRRVEVRRPSGREVRSRRWVSAYPPAVIAEARARRMIEEDVEEGELSVAASYFSGDGVVRAVTAPADASRPLGGPLRATLAVARDGGGIEFSHQLISPSDLPPAADDGALGFALASTSAGDADTLSLLLVEDLSGGEWGSAFVRLGGVDSQDTLAGSFVLPAPKAVHLLLPSEPMLLGPTGFDTVAGPRVARVDFYLDDELQVRRDEEPFSARLDLGRLPRPRRVEAIAFDGTGREVGRDALTVNEGTGNFRVRILRPTAEERAGISSPRVGPIEVEAGLRIPGGAQLERIEYYWKDTLVGTRFAPPFVQRVDVPAANPTGFLRVVGYLEDGTSAEDVAFVNSPAGSEDLRVELVELYTVVTDRRGRPVRGLTESDFQVVEGGVEQEIATFSDAGERPLTVGLAIDSSASMFVKLPEVQLAAASFLTGLRSRRDRAFVVGFGDEPFLQRDTTSDLTAVRAAVAALRPAGRTSIWKGIAYSLVQLQGVPGKKALIVFSDGADEDPNFSYRLAFDFARRVGVPVYVVVSNDEIYRTQGRGLTIRGFMNRLESLTAAVGGRVFLTRVGEDLEAIYRDIDEELRSQYLLGYYVSDREGEEWRSIEVEVDHPGARARTITGYYQ